MLIRGDKLTARQREQVLSAFVHRNTLEHPFPGAGGRPTTDAEWLRGHAFHFLADGSRLMAGRHAEHAFMAAEAP